jgi:hypothetical protein
MLALLAVVVLVLGLVVGLVLELLYRRVRALEVDLQQVEAELDSLGRRGPLIWVVVAAALLGGACGPPVVDTAPKPDQARALELVWGQVYRMEHLEAPSIGWVSADQLDCNGDTGWSEGGLCVYGVSWGTAETGHQAMVAWPKGARFSSTAFAHEMLHRALGGDPEHTHKTWGPGGRLEVANQLLRDSGL